MTSRGMRAAAVALMALASGAGARAEGDLAAVPRMRLEEFKKEVDQDKLLVLDVRAPESYRTGHIPGAVNAPLGELTAGSAQIARLKASKKPIVAYCA
jgi:3-mercaptopyruvate sulfurtransferase SseA